MRISFLLYPMEYMAMIGRYMIGTNGSRCLFRHELVVVQGAGDVG